METQFREEILELFSKIAYPKVSTEGPKEFDLVSRIDRDLRDSFIPPPPGRQKKVVVVSK